MKLPKSLLLSTLLFASVSLFAQDKAKDTAMSAQQEKEMQAWMQYMTPGPVHKMLASANGEWNEELTFWMAPDAPPQNMKAECTNTMILGDRYQESIHRGEMMGMPFEGKSLVGYDNIRKVMQSTWVDNMGTGVMYMEGPYDEKTNSCTLTGTMVDPMTGKVEKVREVFKFIDDSTQLMEMYTTKNGKEFKSMEIKFTKK